MELGGHKIAKGEMLGVAVFSMHNNPAYWQARRAPPGSPSMRTAMPRAGRRAPLQGLPACTEQHCPLAGCAHALSASARAHVPLT